MTILNLETFASNHFSSVTIFFAAFFISFEIYPVIFRIEAFFLDNFSFLLITIL